MQRREADEALAALDEYLDEVEQGRGETLFREAGEFLFGAADAVVNDLSAIRYATDAGLPVIGWSPAVKNADESERVLRSMRQWDEGSRLLLQQLAAGEINAQQFNDALAALYSQQAMNAYIAGRRAVGDLSPLTPDEFAAVEDDISDDVFRLRNWATPGINDVEIAGEDSLSVGRLLALMILDPFNYFGSGLPGDPMKDWPFPFGQGKPKPSRAAKAAASNIAGGPWANTEMNKYQNRIDQYGRSIRARQFAGETDALNKYVPKNAQLVWWVLGSTDHCIDCVRLSDMSPYYGDALMGIHPGSGHTRCGGNCGCMLEYDLPSTICADPFKGAGLADFGIGGEFTMQESEDSRIFVVESTRKDLSAVKLLESAAEPGKVNVFIQEADSCALPVDIASLNARDEFTIIDDSEAFTWSQDVQALMTGSLDESFGWDALMRRLANLATKRELVQAMTDAQLRRLRFLFEPVAGAIPGGLDGVRIATYQADGATFAAAWRETGDAVRLEVGMLVEGLPVLDSDFTLRVMNDLSERAAERGLRFEINGATLNPGARRWLDTLGAEVFASMPTPPTVIPAYPLRGIAPAPPLTFEFLDEADAWARRMWPAPDDVDQFVLSRAPHRLGMTQVEYDALNSYVGGHYGYLNKRLRGQEFLEDALEMAGFENLDEVDNWIAAIDGVLARQAVPEDVVVWRGISKSGLEGLSPEEAIGRTFTEKGYMSTTVGPMPALDRTFAGVDYDMHLRLTVPEGTPGYYARNVSGFAEEAELLLAHGLDFQVTGARRVGKEWIIDAQVIPKAPEARPLRGIAPEPASQAPELASREAYYAAGNMDWKAARRAQAEAFDAVGDDDFVWVFHATTEAQSDEFLATGVRTADVPDTLGRQRYRAGEPAEFAPGAGVGQGTYVGGTAYSVEGYGRRTVAMRVRKRDLVIPPEQEGLSTTVGQALASHDGALLVADVPPQNIIRLKYTGRVPGDSYDEIVAALDEAEVLRGISPAARIPAISKSRVHEWETLRPWERTLDEVRAGQVPGFAALDDYSQPGRGRIQARADFETIKVGTPFFELPVGERAMVLYHEVGHYITNYIGNVGGPLAPWRVPGPRVQWDIPWYSGQGVPLAGGAVPAERAGEVFADVYQEMAFGMLGGIDDWAEDRLLFYAKVALEAERIGLPTGQRWVYNWADDTISVGDGTIHPRIAEAMGRLREPTQPLRGVDPVAALPQWPEMSLLKEATPSAVKPLGGVEPKRLFTDPAGNLWLAKTRPATAIAETAAARLGHELGLRMPPVRMVEIDGVPMSLQPMVPGEDLAKRVGFLPPEGGVHPGLSPTTAAAKALTDEQMSELAGQAILDFVIANADTHAANFIVDNAGHLWGIDKGLGFRGAVATSSNPAAFFDLGHLFDNAVEHASDTGFFLKTSPDDFARVLDRLDGMDAKRFGDLFSLGEGRNAINLIEEPFGNFVTKTKALQKRKAAAREGFAQYLDNAITNAGKAVSPEWRAWKESGSTFVRRAIEPAPHAIVTPPPTAVPTATGTTAIPAMWRTTINQPSRVGNNRATWQSGFRPAVSRPAAEGRIRAILTGLEDATLDGFDLPQMNVMLARLEHLRERGVDMSLLRRLSDYSTVPVSEHNFSIGLTVGRDIHLKHDNLWRFNPVTDSHPTAYDDIGGLLAHEYGHVVFHQLSPGAQAQMIDLYKVHRLTAADDISTYAVENLDEWFGEAFAAITAPGYAPGTIRYDNELWAILAADKKVRLLDLPTAKPVLDVVPPVPEIIAKGPHKATVEMVPVATLRRYADIDIKSLDQNLVRKVREDIAAHGMREPIVLQYSRTERRLALTEGAARLAVARELGVKYVPARVERASGPFSGMTGVRSKAVPAPTFPDDYVPRSIRPSQVIPPEEWSTTAVFDDVVTAPPIPPLLPDPAPAPFEVPVAELSLKPLPPGKKLGGMTSKQIYADPSGREWLVKPKKAFADDVEMGVKAINVEAAVGPLAQRIDLNIAAVRAIDVEYPWVPGEPLKHMGASAQPMVPGVVPVPTVPFPTVSQLLPKAKVLIDDLPSEVADVVALRLAGLREQGVDLSLVKGLRYDPNLGASGVASPTLDPKVKGNAQVVHFSEMLTPDGVGKTVGDTVAHEIGHIVERKLSGKAHLRLTKMAKDWKQVSKYAERTGEFIPEVFAAVTSPDYAFGANPVLDAARAILIEEKIITPAVLHGSAITAGGRVRAKVVGNLDWDSLSDENLNDFARHQMFDWWVGNDDGHPGQWLLEPDGRLIGIDKDAAFWELPSQYAQGDSIPEYGKHVVHTWWHDMTPERLDRLEPKTVERMLDQIDAIPDTEYRAYIEPHLDALTAHPSAVKISREQWADAIMARKRNMRADFTSYYQRQLASMVDNGLELPTKWKTVLDRGFREAVPHRRPLPNPATRQNLIDAEEAWRKVRGGVEDVLEGRREVAIGWTVQDYDKANSAGLAYRKIGGFRFHAVNEEALDRLSAYINTPGHSSMDDGWWLAMGYTQEQVDIRNTLQRLMRPVANPTEGLPFSARGGFIEAPVGDPIGPPKKAPAKAWFKPADHQIYTLPESSVPLNGPRVEWSGKVPDEPPPPVGKATKEQIDAARKAAEPAYGTVDEVANGKRDAMWSWDQSDAKAAQDMGMVYETYKGARIITRTQQKMDELKALLDSGVDSGTDEFWNALGYTQRDLDLIDTAYDITKTMRVGAGVIIVEPDGRLWVLAPRGEWAGYQNTFVKGGVDKGETMAEAAVREVREEVGFSVELDSYLGDYVNSDGTAISRMYIGHRTGGGPLWAKQKETYEMRLVTREQAKEMLTRRGKPDPRDQRVLADTIEALEGTPGLIDFSIPTADVGEFAAKTAPAAATPSVGPPPRTAAQRAVNPEPVPDWPVSTAFAYEKPMLTEAMADWQESGPSTKFPWSITRYPAPNNEIGTMYWQERIAGTTKYVFWGNSKKQVTDPGRRWAQHVAQVVRMGDWFATHADYATLRVNETLLKNVSQLREMLIAAGAVTGGTNKWVEIDRNALLKLADAIKNDTPLPSITPHIPTAPLNPTPKVVGGAGWNVADVGGLLNNSTVTVGTAANSQLPLLQAQWSLGGMQVNSDIGEVLGNHVAILGSTVGLSPTDAHAVTMANIGAALGYAADHPQIKYVMLQVGWADEFPNVQSLLDNLGFTKDDVGVYMASVDGLQVLKANMILNLSQEGYSPALLQGLPAVAPVTPTVPGAPEFAAKYAFDDVHLAHATTSGEAMVHAAGEDYQSIILKAPAGKGAIEARWQPKGSNLNVTSITHTGGALQADKAGLAVRALLHLADTVDLDASVKTLVIEEAAVLRIPTLIRQMLLDYGADLNTKMGLFIHRSDLINWRDSLMLGAAPPLPYLAPGPLPAALDYDPATLPIPIVSVAETGAMKMVTQGTEAMYRPHLDGLRIMSPFATTAQATDEALRLAALGNLRYLGNIVQVDTKVKRVFVEMGFPEDVRAALLNRGGVVKANRIVMDREQFIAFADELGGPSPVTAAGAPVMQAYDISDNLAMIAYHHWIPEGKDTSTIATLGGTKTAIVETTPGRHYWEALSWQPEGGVPNAAHQNAAVFGTLLGILQEGPSALATPTHQLIVGSAVLDKYPALRTFLVNAGATVTTTGRILIEPDFGAGLINTLRNNLPVPPPVGVVTPPPAAVVPPTPESAGDSLDFLSTKDDKVTVDGKKMTQTNYTKVVTKGTEEYTHGFAIWWRIGNDIEVAEASGLTDAAFRAHVVKMAAVMEQNPKIKLLRWRNALDTNLGLTEPQKDLLAKVGATAYNNISLKLTRQQAFDLREQIVSEVAAAAATPAPAATALGDAYGFDSALAGKLSGTPTKQTGQYAKMEWTLPEGQGKVTGRWATLKTELVWDRIFADKAGEAFFTSGAVRQFKFLAAILDASDETTTRIRFHRLDQMPKQFREMLEAHGATVSGDVMYMGRHEAVDLHHALEAEFGHAPAFAAADNVPVPVEHTSEAGLWDIAGAIPYLTPAKIDDHMPNGIKSRLWPNGVSTYEHIEQLSTGEQWFKVIGITHSGSKTAEEQMAAVMSVLYNAAKAAPMLDNTRVAIRLKALEIGGENGAGQAFRDALIAAGAGEQNGYLVLDTSLQYAVRNALELNTKITPIPFTEVAEKITPKTAGATLSAQWGYDASKLSEMPFSVTEEFAPDAFNTLTIVDSTVTGTAASPPTYAFLYRDLDEELLGGKYTTINPVSFGDTKDNIEAQIAALQWLDLHMQSYPTLDGAMLVGPWRADVYDLVVAMGGTDPMETGQIVITKDAIHKMALKIDSNEAIEATLMGSAAEAIPLTTAKPDVLPTIGFADTDTQTAGLFDQHAPTLYGMKEPGGNATSYTNAMIGSEWEATAEEIVWTGLFKNDQMVGDYEMRRAALAEVRRFAKHIEAEQMDSLLVTYELLQSQVGNDLKALLVGYGGKVQNSGAVVIKRRNLTDLWHAIDDQTGFAPISGAAQGTLADVGLYSHDQMVAMTPSLTLGDAPGNPLDHASYPNYPVTSFQKSMVFNNKAAANFIWGFDPNGMLAWETFAVSKFVTVPQQHAIAATSFRVLLNHADANATGLVISPAALVEAPGVKAMLDAAGAEVSASGYYRLLPGNDGVAKFLDAFSMNTVPTVSVVPTATAAGAVVLPDNIAKIDDLIEKMQDGSIGISTGNESLKSLGHPGDFDSTIYGKGPPTSDDFNDLEEIMDAWNAGNITTHQAQNISVAIGAHTIPESTAFWSNPSPNYLIAPTTSKTPQSAISDVLAKIDTELDWFQDGNWVPMGMNAEAAAAQANKTLKPLGHPGITAADYQPFVTVSSWDDLPSEQIVAKWNAGVISTKKANDFFAAKGSTLNVFEHAGAAQPATAPSYLIAAQGDIAAGLAPGAGAATPGTAVAQPTAPPPSLSAQMTGKSAAQLAEDWKPKSTWSEGYWQNSDTSLPMTAGYGDAAMTPTQQVRIGIIEYKPRRIITSPHHGKAGSNVGTGGKGRWYYGTEEQRAEVLWLEFKRSVDKALAPNQVWKGGTYDAAGNYIPAGYVTPGPKALFVHGDATRMNPKIKEIIEMFGGKKKTLKQAAIGTGFEVPAANMADLKAFLDADAPFTPKFTGVLAPPPAAPPPPSVLGTAPATPPAAAVTPPPSAPAPQVVAPPPAPTVTAGSSYGYDDTMVANLIHDADATVPSLLVALKSKPGAKTQVFEDQWANNVTVTWANEPMTKKSRVLRIRSAALGSGTTPFGTAGANALLATMSRMPDRLAAAPVDLPLIAVIIDKKAMGGMSKGLGQMLKDAGWKETSASWTLKKEQVGDFVKAIKTGKAPWMPASIMPQGPVAAAPQPTVPVGQAVDTTPVTPPPPVVPPTPTGPPPAPPSAEAIALKGAPKKATPSFIYGYDNANQKHIGAALGDVDRPDAVDALGKPVQEGVAAYITAHKDMQAHWSVSKSGKAVGWTNIVMDPNLPPEEARDAAFAMLRHIAAQGSVREKFFISPQAYDQIQGLRQMLLDVGGTEQSYAVIGTAVEISAEQAGKLVAALDTNAMTGLKVKITTTSDYLGFDAAALETLDEHPKFIDAFHYEWKTGDERGVMEVIADLDERVMTLQKVDGPTASARGLAMMSQLRWASDQGIEELTVLPSLVREIPNLDRWLLSLGATVDDGNLVLDAVAINNARKHIAKNALPDLLGGAKLPYSIVDELNSSSLQVVDALHNELVTAAKTGKVTNYAIGGREIKSTWARSDSNIYWSGIERGDGASIGQMRTAAAAELRTFVNDIAQNSHLQSVDISMRVIDEVPQLRAVLLKYGAREVPAKGGADAYISLDRSKSLKLRNDIEAELTEASLGVAGASFISQHNALVKWPAAEDLVPSQTSYAKKVLATGQTRKMVYQDANGDQWLFKPGATGRGAAADMASAQLSEMLGLPTPPVRMYTLEFRGEMVNGSLQKMIPNVKGMKEAGHMTPASLSPKHTEELMRHSVLDWLVNNDDAHIGNFLIDPEDNFWAIDRTRAYTSFHTHQDVLDTMSEGNLGGTPWLFQFFRDARADPDLLRKIHPMTFSRPLRLLRNISDEQFLRIVDPVATAKAADRSRGGAYYGKKQKLLDDMLKRKHESAQDFERYLSGELKHIAGLHPGRLPSEWQTWLDNGGVINLDATPRDLLLERKAMLEAKHGVKPGREAIDYVRRAMQDHKLSKVASLVTRYFGGSGMLGAGSGKWGAERIIPKLKAEGAEHLVNEWRELNELGILNIVEHPDAASGYQNDLLRQYYNAEKGTFRITRTTDRFRGDPSAYIPGYRQAGGLRGLIGTAVGKYVWVGASRTNGVSMWLEVNPDQVFSNWALGFGLSGENELLVYDVRLDQIVRISKGEPSLSGMMDYTGPVVA